MVGRANAGFEYPIITVEYDEIGSRSHVPHGHEKEVRFFDGFGQGVPLFGSKQFLGMCDDLDGGIRVRPRLQPICDYRIFFGCPADSDHHRVWPKRVRPS